jgi:hypothetical protein
MEFVITNTNHVYPILFEQHGIFQRYDQVLAYDKHGNITGYRPKLQAQLTSFTNMWLKNIAYQQDLLKHFSAPAG